MHGREWVAVRERSGDLERDVVRNAVFDFKFELDLLKGGDNGNGVGDLKRIELRDCDCLSD